MMAKPGFRTQAKATKKVQKKQVDEFQKTATNIQQSIQLMQMMIMNMGNSIRAFNADLNNAMMNINDLEYRTQAMIRAKTFDEETINTLSTELKIQAYELADKEADLKMNLSPVDIVSNRSHVIITSITPDEKEDRGILRSKILVNNSPSMQFKEAILDKRVGDIFESVIDGVKHVITILKITEPPKQEAQADEQNG